MSTICAFALAAEMIEPGQQVVVSLPIRDRLQNVLLFTLDPIAPPNDQTKQPLCDITVQIGTGSSDASNPSLFNSRVEYKTQSHFSKHAMTISIAQSNMIRVIMKNLRTEKIVINVTQTDSISMEYDSEFFVELIEPMLYINVVVANIALSISSCSLNTEYTISNSPSFAPALNFPAQNNNMVLYVNFPVIFYIKKQSEVSRFRLRSSPIRTTSAYYLYSFIMGENGIIRNDRRQFRFGKVSIIDRNGAAVENSNILYSAVYSSELANLKKYVDCQIPSPDVYTFDSQPDVVTALPMDNRKFYMTVVANITEFRPLSYEYLEVIPSSYFDMYINLNTNAIKIVVIVFSVLLFLACACNAAKIYMMKKAKMIS